YAGHRPGDGRPAVGGLHAPRIPVDPLSRSRRTIMVMKSRLTNEVHRSRRAFLRDMSAAALATLALGEPRPSRGDEVVVHPRPKADTCILLWMAGGMASPETFDPKRYAPFEIGLPSEQILCTFPAIDTALDGIKISQGLEHVAQVLDRG